MSPDREGFSHEASPKDERLEGWVMLIPHLFTQHPDTVLVVFDIKGEKLYEGGGQLVLASDGKTLQIKIGKSLKALSPQNYNQFRLGEASIDTLKKYKEERDADQERRRRSMIRPAPMEITFDEAHFERELRRLRLEKLDVPGYPAADALIKKIMIDPKTNKPYWDIRNKTGKEAFFRDWRDKCGTLPPPGLPWEELFKILNGEGQFFPEYTSYLVQKQGDTWYLERLATNNIVRYSSSLPNNTVPRLPVFGKKETVYAMDWEEVDWNAEGASGKSRLTTPAYSQPLLKELGIDIDGVVKLSRKQIDEALWIGEPGDRNKSQRHFQIIKKMGLHPGEWELSCIRQDQYARLATMKKWGKKGLVTHFDGFALVSDPRVKTYGLCGGQVGKGGASNIENIDIDQTSPQVAVRLVLQKIIR